MLLNYSRNYERYILTLGIEPKSYSHIKKDPQCD